MLLACFIVLLI